MARQKLQLLGRAHKPRDHAATLVDGLDLAFGRRCRLVDRVAGDRDDDSAIAIRGPLGTFNDDVDATPSDRFDGLDDPVELDWAA